MTGSGERRGGDPPPPLGSRRGAGTTVWGCAVPFSYQRRCGGRFFLRRAGEGGPGDIESMDYPIYPAETGEFPLRAGGNGC